MCGYKKERIQMYETGELVYVKGLADVRPIERIFELNIDNKYQSIFKIGNFNLYEKNIRKGTSSEIKKYKLKNIFIDKI
jgi:hypothetical protein